MRYHTARIQLSASRQSTEETKADDPDYVAGFSIDEPDVFEGEFAGTLVKVCELQRRFMTSLVNCVLRSIINACLSVQPLRDLP